MSFGYCTKCKKNVGDQFIWANDLVWRCSKCDTELKIPKTETTVAGRKAVVKLFTEWKKFEKAFNRLPRKIRTQLRELIEFENTGEKPPGRCISDAFKEWLEGGRT